MIIIHENLPKETGWIASILKKVYGFQSQILEYNLDKVFKSIPKFSGYWGSPIELIKHLNEYRNKKILIVTPKDLYSDAESKDDDWILGYHYENIALVTTARLKRSDSQPSDKLMVHDELYIKRLEDIAIHEIGHGVIHADHYQEATWFNCRTKHKLDLGLHCTDNTCVMYEIVDIKAPLPTEGYMLLGTEKKYDAGLDDLLDRIRPDWFCDKCKKAIKINASYE